MSVHSNELISELQAEKRFCGTCPHCQDEFRLADIALFSADASIPEAALAAIQSAREVIKERKQHLIAARERMTKKAEVTSQAVNLGKIVEKIVPSFAGFSYDGEDCRALFEPIDYLIFSGLEKFGRVDALYFVDVKSGGARLNVGQRSIKDTIEAGAVGFATIK